MKWLTAVLPTALLLLAPITGAQSTYGADDASDDVLYDVFPVGPAPALRDHPSIDLIRLSIEEIDDASFAVEATVAGDDPLEVAPRLELFFQYGTFTYRIGDLWYCPNFSNQLSLDVRRGDVGTFQEAGCVDGGWEGNTFSATIPKELVRDERALPVAAGSLLGGMWAETDDIVSLYPPAWARDRAPDDGVVPGGLTMVLGQGVVGDLVVATPSPMRSSNGGPDTMVFPVHIENRADHGVAPILQVADVPPGWDVRTPSRLALEAGEATTIPVVVTTASAHAHGITEGFRLEVRTEDAVGSIDLGIHYLDVPQLAGHHPALFFHSRELDTGDAITTSGPTFLPWFNTLEVDPGADDGPFRTAGGSGAQNTDVHAQWVIPLDPSLLIGMDFDLERAGKLVIEFVSQETVGDVRLQARLMHCNPLDETGDAPANDECPIGSWFEMGRTGPGAVAMTPGSRATWETELSFDDYANLVPYVEGSNIELWIQGNLTGVFLASRFPDIDPVGSRMTLPLNEYKDPIDAAFEDLTSLRLTPLDPFEKKANPGQTVWFTFDVHNAGGSRTVAANTFGHNAAWAKVNPERLHLAPEGAGRFHLGIDVPSGAATGEFAEVLLLVEDADDPAVTAVSKVRVVVVDEEVPTDPAPHMDVKDRESPAMFVAAIGAVALAALRRRH